MKNFFFRHRSLIVIFAIALVARIILLLVNLHAAGGDFELAIHGDDGYYEVSKNLVEGKGFSMDGVIESPIHVPIYPYFLAALLYISKSYVFTIGVQIFLGAFIPVFATILVRKIFGKGKIALITGLILAVEPYFLLFSTIFYTETLFIFFFLLFILAFLKYLEKGEMKILLLATSLLAISSLIKTTVQFLPVFIVPFMFWALRSTLPWKKVLLHSAVLVAGFMLILSPWLYRSYRVFGTPGMTVMPTYNLYTCFVPSVLAIANKTSFAEEQKKFIADRNISMADLTPNNAHVYAEEAMGIIKEHPAAIIKVALINVFTFFTHDGVLTFLGHAGIHPDFTLGKPALFLFFSSPVEFLKTIVHFASSPFLLLIVMRLFWIAVTIFFLKGIYFFIRKRGFEKSLIFLLVLVLYFAATTPSNGLTVNARFRMPIDPIILMLAGYGAVNSYRFWKGKWQNRKGSSGGPSSNIC